MKWGTVVALFGLAAGIIYIYIVCFLFLGCRACAWTGTAPGVLGLGRPRVLGRPSHPPSSYHPKGGLIGMYLYEYRYIYIYVYINRHTYTHAGIYIPIVRTL